MLWAEHTKCTHKVHQPPTPPHTHQTHHLRSCAPITYLPPTPQPHLTRGWCPNRKPCVFQSGPACLTWFTHPHTTCPPPPKHISLVAGA